MKYKAIPEEQRILVLPVEGPEMVGHIIIPESVRKDNGKPKTGHVVEVGEGSKDRPMKYHKGQLVVFSQYSGSEIELDLGDGPNTYIIMQQMDVWMKLEEIE